MSVILIYHLLKCQVVNLPNLRIIDFSYGRTGSTHDSLAFKDTRSFKEHIDIFDTGEWIWADSAYTVRSFPRLRPLSVTDTM
jgi:hypothetical protein